MNMIEWEAKTWIERRIERRLWSHEWQDYRDLAHALAVAAEIGNPHMQCQEWAYIKMHIGAGWRPSHGDDSPPLSTQLIQWQAEQMNTLESAFDQFKSAINYASEVISRFWDDLAAALKPKDGIAQPPRPEARNVNPKRRHWESDKFTPARKRGRKR